MSFPTADLRQKTEKKNIYIYIMQPAAGTAQLVRRLSFEQANREIVVRFQTTPRGSCFAKISRQALGPTVNF
jgi:hypothetical protein